MSYLTLTFLGMLLVAQSCFAIPRPDAESAASHHEFNKDNKLYKATLAAFVKFAVPLGEHYGDILEKVAEDLKNHEEAAKYEVQIKHLEDLAKGSEHLKADCDEKTLLNIVKLKSDLIGANKPSDDAVKPNFIRELFDKDGGKEFVEEFRKNLIEFFDGFDDAFEEYSKDLSEEEKAEHSDFLKWFKAYKEADGAEARFEKF
uniref:Uncharacterized protein n=1 Tax=Glossina brevipalpis TaxID=37001 RepID=A0A1A9W3X0_9MUSC